ncbi:ATP synthase F1, gamma subunit [Basidiobolus meristosporus CBS 931.73]|uniref:ATP synthase subunit gamma n=1 Tax=Basidiobolus meristosporus CBS 931.73 TaxID=1314790 RepID=A0A1Y1Y6J6_9FUNG|nr:ATP synthase F1, gamma subunit [Basidiobolus meristosporus CBS 931.73]|eukprot:ORX93650.1 ATP synthase F1, gamma subunit [Basidiobolus meristosporus CBS 931.73]
MLTATRIVPTATRGALSIQTRNMATLKEIQLRLKAISNTAKITKSMKMIASTKLNRAQKNMNNARAYGQTSIDIYKQSEVESPADARQVIVTVSSDRGLCGGIHSSVSKATKRIIAQQPESTVVVLGDKAKPQIARTNRDSIAMSFNQLGKSNPTFTEACAIVDTMRASEVDFDTAQIIYNKFTSAIAYEADSIPVYSEEVIKTGAKFAEYELEEDEVLQNLKEFTFANALYWGLAEGHASEMSAKMTAMENATRNASEVIDKLTLAYNRGRQAVITNELIDIVTGASAL